MPIYDFTFPAPTAGFPVSITEDGVEVETATVGSASTPYAPIVVSVELPEGHYVGEAVGPQLSRDRATGVADILGSVATQRYADVGGYYLPTPYADLVWRTRRAETLAGSRQGHIAIMGDSIPFGAAATGTTSPKYASNYPGRLRDALANKYGKSGTGVVILDQNIVTTPAYDNRIVFSGGHTAPAMGWHAAAARSLTAASAGTLTFTAEGEEFWIYNLQASGGLNNVAIDGAASQTFRNLGTGGTAPALAASSGYHPIHIVTRVPAGALGSHTMVITTNGTHNAVLIAVEARVPTLGTFRVSNPSINSKSLTTFLANNGETNGLYGLPLIDTLRADLLIVALGINNWQGQTPIATVKAHLATIIDRQRATGTPTGGGTYASGDAMLLWSPKPNVDALVPGAAISWEEYRDAYYEVSEEKNVALLDFGERWNDFDTANGMGLFADTIHPNNKGSLDISAGLLAPLGL